MDWNNIEEIINFESMEKMGSSFLSAKPFPFVIIDNFFKPNVAKELENEFPSFDDNVWHEYNNPLEIKKTCNDWNKFNTTTYNLFRFLNSDRFIELLQSKLMLDYKLFPDPGLNGGGWHIHKSGGKLNTHLDYSLHPKLNLQRRINLILYINSNWRSEWNGSLGFWGNESSEVPGDLIESIDCLYNRAVIFDTSQNSWHGLPEPVICPDNEYRKSLAIYYLSEPTNNMSDRGKALFSPSKDQEGSDEIKELIRLRSGTNSAENVYKK